MVVSQAMPASRRSEKTAIAEPGLSVDLSLAGLVLEAASPVLPAPRAAIDDEDDDDAPARDAEEGEDGWEADEADDGAPAIPFEDEFDEEDFDDDFDDDFAEDADSDDPEDEESSSS